MYVQYLRTYTSSAHETPAKTDMQYHPALKSSEELALGLALALVEVLGETDTDMETETEGSGENETESDGDGDTLGDGDGDGSQQHGSSVTGTPSAVMKIFPPTIRAYLIA